MRLEVSGQIECLAELNAGLQTEWSRLELPEEQLFPFELSLEEIFTNVVKYGQDAAEPARVIVTLTRDGDSVVMEISDSGFAFDPLLAATPDTSLDIDDRAIGGLGIHLVREMMTRVDYERRDGYNVLTMRKDLG